MLKILQAQLQQYVNWEPLNIQTGFGKAEEPEIKLLTFTGSQENQGNSRKTSTSALLTTLKSLTVDHNNLWQILKKKGIPDHITCFLRNLYAGQEARVRTQQGTMDWFKTGKVIQGCILSPCLFNLYAAYIMWNAGLDESQLESRSTSSDKQMTPL